MATTFITSREFDQDASGAKRRAANGPVFITGRGRPTHVLLSIEDYRRLHSKPLSVADSLVQTGPKGDFDFDPPKSRELDAPRQLDG